VIEANTEGKKNVQYSSNSKRSVKLNTNKIKNVEVFSDFKLNPKKLK